MEKKNTYQLAVGSTWKADQKCALIAVLGIHKTTFIYLNHLGYIVFQKIAAILFWSTLPSFLSRFFQQFSLGNRFMKKSCCQFFNKDVCKGGCNLIGVLWGLCVLNVIFKVCGTKLTVLAVRNKFIVILHVNKSTSVIFFSRAFWMRSSNLSLSKLAFSW